MRQLLILFICLASNFAWAKRPPLDPSKVIQLQYENSSWNIDSTKIDDALVILKDARTNRVVLIRLQETGPDSSVFAGIYSITWGLADDVIPEIFIPDQQMIRNREGRKKLVTAMKKKKIKRKPFIVSRDPRGIQTIDVFDTKAQAKKRLSLINQGLQLRQRRIKEQLADQSTFDAAQLAQMNKNKLEALQRMSERDRLEQIERQKQASRLAKAKNSSNAEKEQNKEQARQLATEAIEHFKKGNFKLAEEKFAKSVELDPEETSYYYSYAVTLYRNDKFNDAIVKFRLSNAPNPVEKDYYLGLSYYRLKEFENAKEVFKKVKDSKDENLGPSAAFYLGVVQLQETKYTEAIASFEHVLDNSKDPNLDQQAENYIETCIKLRRLAEANKNKFFITATVGMQEDSNILLTPDGTEAANTAENQGGQRILSSLDFKYRPYRNENHELYLGANVTGIYSLDDQFSAADPLSYSIGIPYSYKTTFLDKAYKMEFHPSYDVLHLDANDDGTQEALLNSIVVRNNHTLIMSKSWFTALQFTYWQNDSQIEVTDEADEADATKIRLNWNNIVFVNQENTQALIGDLGYISNAADGENRAFDRYDVALSYLTPLGFWQLINISRFAFYNAAYENDRTDDNITISNNISKPINPWLSAVLSLSWTDNASSVDQFTYDKYIIGILLNAKHNF